LLPVLTTCGVCIIGAIVGVVTTVLGG